MWRCFISVCAGTCIFLLAHVFHVFLLHHRFDRIFICFGISIALVLVLKMTSNKPTFLCFGLTFFSCLEAIFFSGLCFFGAQTYRTFSSLTFFPGQLTPEADHQGSLTSMSLDPVESREVSRVGLATKPKKNMNNVMWYFQILFSKR